MRYSQLTSLVLRVSTREIFPCAALTWVDEPSKRAKPGRRAGKGSSREYTMVYYGQPSGNSCPLRRHARIFARTYVQNPADTYTCAHVGASMSDSARLHNMLYTNPKFRISCIPRMPEYTPSQTTQPSRNYRQVTYVHGNPPSRGPCRLRGMRVGRSNATVAGVG